MPRRGSRRITVIGVGTPPPLTSLTLRPLAMEILRRSERSLAVSDAVGDGSGRSPALRFAPTEQESGLDETLPFKLQAQRGAIR
jgi:hypothetical protein